MTIAMNFKEVGSVTDWLWSKSIIVAEPEVTEYKMRGVGHDKGQQK